MEGGNTSNSNVYSEASDAAPSRKPGRKGHRKSRTGCMNCKRARIKCKENKPACDYCAHRDLQCIWPELMIHQQYSEISCSKKSTPDSQLEPWKPSRHLTDSASTTSSSDAIPHTLHQPGPVFSMQDFRLFNLFIQKAYPHHPIGNDKIWRHEIPCLASDYDYLLHSMLALAGSELACTTDPTPQMHDTALTHRVKAITSLNSAVARGIHSYEEGNAIIAACFSLLFQSCLIEDGLMEYMMFIRGTVSIGWSMGTRRMKFLFNKIFDSEQLEQVEPMMVAAPLLNHNLVAAACRSFERFKHLCLRKVEIDVFVTLSGIANSLITSSRDAYLGLRKMYELFSYTMPQPEFEQYCDASSVVCQLLQAHFAALQLVMAPVTKPEQQFKEAEIGKQPDQNGRTVTWLVGIHRRVPDEWKEYFAWTKWVEKEVLSGNLYNGRVRDEQEPGALNEVMGSWNDDWQVVMGSR